MASVFELLKKIGMSEDKTPSEPPEYIIVGLGNPGDKYEKTRHNAGFMFLDWMAAKCGFSINRSKYKSLCADATVAGKRVIIMKPQTFMNASGEAVIEAAKFYKIPAEKVIVISDDVTLDVARLRVRRKGSHGGHNGLKSIIAHLGSDAFPRIKIGVGKKPSPEYDLVDFVLGKFSKSDLDTLKSENDAIIASVELMLSGKIEEAMNKYSK